MQKHKHSIHKNTGNIVQCGELVVYSHDCTFDWELWLAAAAQLHESIILYIATWGKDQNSKFKVRFPLNMYRFRTIINWGLSCSSLRPTSTLWKYFKVKSNIELKFFWGEGRVKGDYVCLYITQLPQKLFFVNFFFLSVPHSPAVVPVSFLSLLKMFFSCQLF